jgi:hypothetical protein
MTKAQRLIYTYLHREVWFLLAWFMTESPSLATRGVLEKGERYKRNKGYRTTRLQDRRRLRTTVLTGCMNLMCLNCRGCGRPEAVREFRNIAELHRPKVLFLSKTRMGARKAESELRARLGYPNAFSLNCVGLSGGLALLWSNEGVVELKTYSKNHIDVWVTDDRGIGQQWRFTSFYGDPARSHRKELWRLLKFL